MERQPRVAGVRSAADVARHLRRRGGRIGQPWKAWGERRALRRCLEATERVRSLCDCPCGPGRLLPFWLERGLAVSAVDDAEAAVTAARARLAGHGRALRGDAFRLADVLGAPVDLVASIRFIYYFDAPGREALLRALAAASRRYVLVQYRTCESWRARRNARRGRGRGRHALTRAAMDAELRASGLQPLRAATLGPLSDRVFVLAEKPPA
jgi:SAM-dependent methyltransferase